MYDIDSIFPVLVNERQQINSGGNSVTNPVDTFGRSGGLLVVTLLFDSIGGSVVFNKIELQESDVSGSNYTIVSGCNALTDTQADGSAAPTYDASSDHSMIVFYVPLIGARKRYFRIRANNTESANAGMSCTAVIIGEQRATGPDTSSTVDGVDGAIFRADNI